MHSLLRIRPAAAALLILSASVATAAPLCRGSKGEFTPCAKGQAGSPSIKLPRVLAVHEAKAKAGQPGSDAAAAGPAELPLVTVSKLCRDSKGLFTPCPR